MVFFLYTFSSDYLREKFIAMESCSLLSSSLPKATPKIFFTRDLCKDCECEILVVETLKKDLRAYKRTQKLAKTVLITATPFTSLDAFLSLGIDCKLVCMNKGEVLFSTASSLLQEEETELKRFSRSFNIERSHELRMFSGLLDVGVLRKKLWLVGTIRNGSGARDDDKPNTLVGNIAANGRSSSPCPREFSLGSEGSIQYDSWRLSSECSDSCETTDKTGHGGVGTGSGRQTAPALGGHGMSIGSIAFAYRYVFKSSTGEPSEHRPIHNMRPRKQPSRNKRSDLESMLYSEAESTDSCAQVSHPFHERTDYDHFCICNDNHMLRIRGIVMNSMTNAVLNSNAVHNSQKRRKRMHRKRKAESDCNDYPL